MDLKEQHHFGGIRHPWERARVSALSTILDLTLPGHPAPSRLLDIGCGDGYAAATLFPQAEISGVDTSLTDEMIDAMTREQRHYYRSFEQIGEVDPFPMALLLDVIEHLPDDRSFLQKEVVPRLTPGGLALVTVPAFQTLFSSHDRFLGHYRRYSRTSLIEVLQQSGFTIRQTGYLFSSLLLPRMATLILEKFIGAKEAPTGVANWQHGESAATIIAALLTMENRLTLSLNSTGINLPGLSLWAVCEKSS